MKTLEQKAVNRAACARWRAKNPDYQARWKEANLERVRGYDTSRRKNNLESERKRNREYMARRRANQPDRVKTIKRLSYARKVAENPEQVREKAHADYMRRKGRQCETKKLWRKRNLEHARNIAARWQARWRKEYPEKARSISRTQGARRYALKKDNGPIEKFLHEEIFERDGWICGICLELVNPDAKDPDPFAVELDHIQPVTKKGPHTRANVQCSHGRCNRIKSDTWPWTRPQR